MHELPNRDQLQLVDSPNPVRWELPDRRSAKVLTVAAVWFLLATLCISPVSAASPVAQEKSAEASSRTEPDDQAAMPEPQPLDLTDQVVRDVLANLQRGIESHNLDLVMAVFDPQNMKDYALFHDQMVAFFRLHDSVKFRYQLLQVAADKDVGFAIADIDMDADPSDILPTQQRRTTQMRFQMKYGPKGWKVTGLRPADFFGQ